MSANIPLVVVFNTDNRAAQDRRGVTALSKTIYDVQILEYPKEEALVGLNQIATEDKAISFMQKVVKSEVVVLVLTSEDDRDAFAFMLCGAALMLNKRVIVVGEPTLDNDLLLFYPTIEIYDSLKELAKSEKVKNG